MICCEFPIVPGDAMLALDNLQELESVLLSNGIDPSRWGLGETKHLQDLWNEIVNGESCLQAEPLQRLVKVARVIIRRGDQVLIEAEQEFADGRRRKRYQPPADKMKPGEGTVQAAARCLVEELCVKPEDIHILPYTQRTEQNESDSPSYPGLHSLFTNHYIDAIVAGLPSSGFWTDNQSAENDPITRHYWVWVPATSLDIPE
jgi:ADP-ribose pyrophosphatase YjhB (NUDIX family)